MIRGNRRWIACVARALIGLSLLAEAGIAMAAEAAANAIKSIDVSQQVGDKVVVKFSMDGAATAPASFAVNSPPRIALDFPNTANQLGKNAMEIGTGVLRSVNVVEVTGRTRVVLNLDKAANYETRTEGNQLFLTLSNVVGGNQSVNISSQFSSASATSSPSAGPNTIQKIDFRRGREGEGKVVVDLKSGNAGIDIRQQGKSLIVELLKVKLPRELERRLDVTDFGTPVQRIDAMSQGGNTKLVIEPKGLWEYSAYQTDSQFVVDVKPVVEDPTRLTQGSKLGYKGDKLSLNFQNVEVRTVLQVIAEFTGLNIITSDTVKGDLTLRLKDVPWDQALEIILQSRGLDQRKNGNVVWIAPRDELAAKEKAELTAKQELSELEPLRTETFQLKYHNAEAFQKILQDDKQKLLSKRGSAVIDTRTNTLFIQDIPARLEELRNLINKVDVAARQVLIEARIVVASDDFSRDLGVKLGLQGQNIKNSTKTGISGSSSSATNLANNGTIPSGGDTMVNLPLASSATGAGTLGVAVLNAARGILLNLELQAMETDGKGKVVSSPRVVTGDRQKAKIEQGQEVPYRTVTSSNGVTTTTIVFKNAALSLEVTPRITPDGKISMDLEIKKDKVDSVAGFDDFVINNKRVFTTVLVGNGDTAIIGGIFEQDQSENKTRVPFLADIPVLGNLFKKSLKKDNKSELLIFITPKILDENLSLR
ncbi:type IV pilus assembly protein PilQ [Chitinivorax tropicus]|uniref:Type IV pilus biogenesis and competence protein PilQ n=1 Tax=Chitinivorax tropicus TaxID=714531 RepID=A0A840ML96_9PROT|nr:type IV pilus secretin PilQ [Chitinivorax tropicus]MBB5017482.1 type IV pilus assembly protein PilQ [Chitinivorax tropicus]